MWTLKEYQLLWKNLSNKKEESYRKFSQKIISTKYPMLGIRIPLLRKQAAIIAKTDVFSYLDLAKDTTYEEVLMQGILLGKLKGKEDLEKYLSAFLSKIDNWAICDMTVSSLKLVAKEKDYFLKVIDTYLKSQEEYTVRVGLVLLLNYYVEDAFLEEIFSRVLKVQSQAYFVEMALAWLLCECYIKNPDKTFTFLKSAPLSYSVLSKTVSKVCDSFQVKMEDKDRLKKYKNQIKLEKVQS